jgi:hypothetical protein
MGFGRFVCVAVPFGLTLASLVCILLTMTAGITSKDLDLFAVTTQNLSISSSSLSNLENLLKRDAAPADHFSSLTTAALNGGSSSSSSTAINITAADLGLADKYKVSLWNYCYTSGSNTTCTKGKFNWAASALNLTSIEALATSTSGVNVTLPTELRTSLKTFTVVTKWTEVVYIIALLTCVLELIVGLFGFCSRAASCVTYLVSGISTFSIIAASIMATVLGSITVGAIESTTKAYGVKAAMNTSFLATTWLAAAFSIGGGMFWMFTICCCASSHNSKKPNSRRARAGDDAEKLIPAGAYTRVEDTHYAGQQSGVYHNHGVFAVPTPNVKPTHHNGAYEPYSHGAI